VLKKASRNKGADNVPDVRADDPERAMEQFTNGLRRVLAAEKPSKRKRKQPRSFRIQKPA
jgi:hypothetical protein